MKMLSFFLPFFALLALASCQQPEVPSNDTEILSIGEELDSKPLESVDRETHDYKVILPHGTDLSALDLDLQLASTEASYSPLTPQDFSNNTSITFTVTAEDGTTQQIYNITVELAPIEPSTDTSITSIGKELGSKPLKSVGPETHDYKVILPHGTDLSALDLDLQLASTEASYSPLTPQDFSNNTSITFTVTAEDGTTQQIYNITVELAPIEPSTDTSITSIGKELGSKPLKSVGPETHDYKVILPHGTDLSALDLDLQLASTEASYSPLTPQDFSNNNPITFTVTAEDGTTQQIYNITVELAPIEPSTDTSITSIGKELDSKLLESVDPETHDYKVILPHGTDLSALDLDLQLASTEASYSPLTPQDFSNNNPITFTVTAEDGTTQEIYNITVELAPIEPSTDTSITSIGEELDSKLLESVDPETHDYKVILPHGTDLSALDLDLQLASTEASYSPLTPQDFSNNNPITFTVTAEDGTTQEIYNITVELVDYTAANIISIHQDLGGAALTADQTNIDSYLVKIPPIKDLKEISLRPEISPGASYEPQTPQDFSNNNPIPFTVTAADGTTTKIYNITVAWTFLVKKDDAGKWNIVQDETEGTRTGIWKIEDLVRLGTADTSVSGDMWKSSDDYVLMENLDFKKEGDYRNPTDTNINADEDSSTTEGIMAELIPNEATLPTNPGFLPLTPKGFTGKFEGNRKTISNLYINRSQQAHVGLFSDAYALSIITKLGIIDANVTGLNRVGALVGRNYGTITQSYTGGKVAGDWDVGGLVGLNTSHTSVINESYSTATIIGKFNRIGGLVGHNGKDGETQEGQGGTIKDNIVFSQRLTLSNPRTTPGEINRVLGKSDSPLMNNYAWSETLVQDEKRSSQDTHSLDGTDLSDTNFKSVNFYENTSTFSKPWDFTDVWQIKPTAQRPTFIESSDDGLLPPSL